MRPIRFKKLTNFEPSLFVNTVVSNLKPYVVLPRNFYLNNDIDFNVSENIITRRGCVLKPEDRIFRWILRLRGVSFDMLEHLFDQDVSVVKRDFVHCCFACILALKDQYLRPLEPNSDECNLLQGNGWFQHFPSAIYAADVTKVCFIAWVDTAV